MGRDIVLTFLLFSLFRRVLGQFNLGSFNLGKAADGGLNLGLGQGGSLFGYGGDRALNLNVGPNRFGARSNSGVTLGNQRLGLESLLGLQEGQGINLGSFLNSGAPAAFDSRGAAQGADPLAGFVNGILGMLKPKETSRPPVSLPNRRQPSKFSHEEVDEGSAEGDDLPTAPPPTEEEMKFLTWERPLRGNKKENQARTEAPIFPTLINTWEEGDGEEKEVTPSTHGNSDNEEEKMPLGSTQWGKGVNTEGWRGQVPSSSNQGQRAGVNSGEASKKSNGRRRGGPAPPDGLVDIDEHLHRVRM